MRVAATMPTTTYVVRRAAMQYPGAAGRSVRRSAWSGILARGLRAGSDLYYPKLRGLSCRSVRQFRETCPVDREKEI